MSAKATVAQPEGQMERGTTLTCQWCLTSFEPRNRNGIIPDCCSRRCKDAMRNAQRLRGAALLKGKKQPRRRGPSRHAQQVSQRVFIALVPIEERAELIRQAAENLGITNQDAIEAAMRRAQVPAYKGNV